MGEIHSYRMDYVDFGASASAAPPGGQNLLFHPHIHCVVPSGGLAPGRTHWIRDSATFFLPLQVLHQVFRGKFIEGLKQAFVQERLSFSGLIQHLADANRFAGRVDITRRYATPECAPRE